MRLRVQIKLAPGPRPNILKGPGGEARDGVRGPLIGIGARGRSYSTVEVPGTDLSWREYQKVDGLGAVARIVRRALWLHGVN